MKRQDKLLGGVFLLSAVLRVLFIVSRSIQYDDAFTLLLASRSLPEIVAGTAADTMPPLYYFMMHFWLLLGREVWMARLLSILISLGSVLLAWRMIVELTANQTAALWTALLVGISPLQIYHAQDIRMYALLGFSELAYMLFFIRLWRSAANFRLAGWDWAGLIVSGGVAFYTHNLAVFWIGIPLVFLVFKQDWRMLGRMVLAVSAIGIVALPWLVRIPAQLEKIQTAFWTPKPGLVEILQTVILFTATIPLPSPWLIVAAVLSIELVVVMGVEIGRVIKTQHGLEVLLFFALLPPALLFAASYLIRPVFVPRGFLASSFAYYGLAGWVIAAGWKGPVGKLVAVGFLAAAVISLPYQLTYAQFPRSPFREAMRALETQVDADSLVLHDNKLSFFPCEYLAPDLPQAFLGDEPGSANDTLAPGSQRALGLTPEKDLSEAVEGVKRVYFVTFETTLENYRALQYGRHPVLAWLEATYDPLGCQTFGDLLIYEYLRR